MGDTKQEVPMWPLFTDTENKFYSEAKKNMETYVEKTKDFVSDVTQFQVRVAKDVIDMINKYSGNSFNVFEDMFTKQAEEYLRTVSVYTKK